MANFTFDNLMSKIPDQRLQILVYELYSAFPALFFADWNAQPSADFSFNVADSGTTASWIDRSSGTYTSAVQTYSQRYGRLRKVARQIGVDVFAGEDTADQLTELARSLAKRMDQSVHAGNMHTVTIPGALSAAGIDGFLPCAQVTSSDTLYLRYTDSSKSWEMSTDNSSWGTAVVLADNADDKVRFPIVSNNAEKFGWVTIDASDCVGGGDIAATALTIAWSLDIPGLSQLVHPDHMIWADLEDIDASGPAGDHDAAFSLNIMEQLLLNLDYTIDASRAAFMVPKKTMLALQNALSAASDVRLSEWKDRSLSTAGGLLTYGNIPIFYSAYLNNTHTIASTSCSEMYLVEMSPEGYSFHFKEGTGYAIGGLAASSSVSTDQWMNSMVFPFRLQPIAEGTSTSVITYRADGLLTPSVKSYQKIAGCWGINN
jgi:hypothetical protein